MMEAVVTEIGLAGFGTRPTDPVRAVGRDRRECGRKTTGAAAECAVGALLHRKAVGDDHDAVRIRGGVIRDTESGYGAGSVVWGMLFTLGELTSCHRSTPFRFLVRSYDGSPSVQSSISDA